MLKHINNEKTLRILEFVVNTIVVISLAWFSVLWFWTKNKKYRSIHATCYNSGGNSATK